LDLRVQTDGRKFLVGEPAIPDILAYYAIDGVDFDFVFALAK
jgi:hypothetical protein